MERSNKCFKVFHNFKQFPKSVIKFLYFTHTYNLVPNPTLLRKGPLYCLPIIKINYLLNALIKNMFDVCYTDYVISPWVVIFCCYIALLCHRTPSTECVRPQQYCDGCAASKPKDNTWYCAGLGLFNITTSKNSLLSLWKLWKFICIS